MGREKPLLNCGDKRSWVATEERTRDIRKKLVWERACDMLKWEVLRDYRGMGQVKCVEVGVGPNFRSTLSGEK